MEISVIVPVYNTEKFLRRCLDSLINQTFKDLEIICVNDGSADGSGDILKEYSGIRVINQENRGLSGARNTGIQAARGRFIGFVDSDDWVDLDFFEKLYEAAVKNNADIACASIVRSRRFFEKFRINYQKEMMYTAIDDKVRAAGIPECCYVWNKIYSREVIKDIEFKENVFYEDILWTPKVLRKANVLVTVPGVKYHYRANPKSIVKSIQSEKKQRDFYYAKRELISFFEKEKIRLDEKKKCITKEKKYFLNLLVLKVKEYKYTQIFYILGFLPFVRITRYPALRV